MRTSTSTFPHRYRALLLLVVLAVITHLDRVCISVAGPRIQDDLHISPQLWGWVGGIFTIAYAIFEVPAGSLGDRIGPRRVLTRIVLWWSAFTALTGAVSSYAVLLVVRFFFGAGEAGAYPNASSAISRWFPPHERGLAHGFIWMAAGVGGVLAPLLVVPIQRAYGWRASFQVFAVLGVLWAVIWYWWYRDNPSQKPGVPQSELDIIKAPAVRAGHAIFPWIVALRNRNLLLIMFMYLTYCCGGSFYVTWLHTYLQKGRGFSEEEMKIYSMLPYAANALGSLMGGLVSDRLSRRYGLKFGRRSVGFLGLAISSVAVLGTGLTSNRISAVVFLTIAGFAMDSALPVAWAVCLDVGRGHSGAVSGTMNTAGQVGSFLSSVSLGYLIPYFGNYNTPMILIAAMLLISAILFLRIDPTQPLVSESINTSA